MAFKINYLLNSLVGVIFSIALLPLMIVISILIFLDSGLPVFYPQKRIGKNGKPFILFKFRSMIRGADAQKQKLIKLNEADGPVFKINDDPRFTGFGKFLSHTGLDELPQLVNIVKGEMSLIGPRPLPVAESNRLTQKQRRRLDVLPGIVSPHILTANYHRSFQKWMDSDLGYVKNKSLFYDLKLTFRAGLFMLRLLWREVTADKRIRQTREKTI